MSGQYGLDTAGEGGSEVAWDNVGMGRGWSSHGFDLIDSLPSIAPYTVQNDTRIKQFI